jgi:hypothetical protein
VSRLISLPPLAPRPDERQPASLPVTLNSAVTEARRHHRPLIAAAGQWALFRGIPLPADHIALWAATAQAAGYPGDVDGITGPWRASHISSLLEAVAAWCTLAGSSPPAEIAESLWHLYGFLAASDRLHPDSDALQELRAAAVVFANFDCIRPISAPPPEPTAA